MAVQTLQEGVTSLSGLLSSSDSLRILRGGQTVTGSIDQNALTDLGNVEISSTASVNLGGGGSNFKAKLTGTLSHAGSGRIYVEAYQGGAASTIARTKLIGPGFIYGRNGTFTRYEQSAGEADFNESSIIPTAIVGGGTFRAAFVTGTTGFQTAIFSGGVVYTERGLDTDASGSKMYVTGGCECHVSRSNITASITQSPGTTNMPMGTGSTASGVIVVSGPGTVLDWQGYTIDTIYVLGGARLDMSAAPVSFSVGNLFVDRKSLLASNWQSKVPGVTITYSAKTIYGSNDDTLPG